MRQSIFKCIDAHTCGNPVRLVTEGVPNLKGNNMMEKRADFLANYDWIRKGLMFEPRGHDMMSGSMLFPPHDLKNDAAVLFIETSGCLPMCGHGTIGTVTIAIQEGLIIPKVAGQLNLETPSGLVKVSYVEEHGKVISVKLVNVPSFLIASQLEVFCEGLGKLVVDVAYGGNFYAIIDPQLNFSGIQEYSTDHLIPWSRKIRKSMNELYRFVHPEQPGINGLSHILWTGEVLNLSSTARNAVFYGEKAIDRSPCGTGTSARMAQWYSQGKLSIGDEFIHESYIGSVFRGQVMKETRVSDYPAIIPSIEGWAKITGYNTILLHEDDPYVEGFQVL